MKKSTLPLVFYFLIISTVLSCSEGSSSKDASATAQQDPSDSGWVDLFNGKDLSGWELVEGTAPYTVENGEIVGTTAPDNPNGILCTKDTFSNFVLELDVKVDTALNSGIQVRSHTMEVKGNKEVYG
jgi:hypothetical protein